MSFLPTSRENWSKFCSKHAQLISQIHGLAVAFSSPDRFGDLLSRGETSSKNATETLASLSADEWRAFEEFVKLYKADWQTYFVETLYPGYFREAARRQP